MMMDRTLTHPTPAAPLGPLGKLWTPAHALKVITAPSIAADAAVDLQAFFHLLNNELGCPHTRHVAVAEVTWATAEGGRAWWNPLNTTRYVAGSWDYNWVHVKSYPSESVGVKAAADTLRQTTGVGDFSEILAHLRNGAPAEHTLKAVERSNWGTGGLALEVLPQVQADYDRWAARHVAPT